MVQVMNSLTSWTGFAAMPELIICLLGLWLSLYFLLIQPRKRQLAVRIAQQNSTTAGDWVLLQSGRFGYVLKISNNQVLIGTSANDPKPLTYSKTAIVKRLLTQPELTI